MWLLVGMGYWVDRHRAVVEPRREVLSTRALFAVFALTVVLEPAASHQRGRGRNPSSARHPHRAGLRHRHGRGRPLVPDLGRDDFEIYDNASCRQSGSSRTTSSRSWS